jgi:C4-dicarboxylate-specific signal transduction histidine kinase
MGNRVQLQQVVLNLLQNGMAVMDNWEGALKATTELTEDGGVHVTVSDAGPPVGFTSEIRRFGGNRLISTTYAALD